MSQNVQLPEYVRRILRLEKGASQDKIISSFKNYSDHIEHGIASKRDIILNFREAQIRANVSEIVLDHAALDISTVSGRGGSIFIKTRNLARVTRSAVLLDKDFVYREGVRTVAELVRIPFVSAKAGTTVKAAVGISQRGRGTLAVKLYDGFIKKTARWTVEDIAWAEKLGISLPAEYKIKVADVAEALTVRLGFLPGKVASASLSLENGKLIPYIRASPPGALRKYFSFNARLRSGAVEDFYRDAVAFKEGNGGTLKNAAGRKWLQERITGTAATATEEARPGLIDEAIFNLRAHSGSNFAADVRFHGTNLDSYGVRAQPDSEIARLSSRYYTKGSERALQLANANKAKAVAAARKIGADEVEAALNAELKVKGFRKTELIILPRTEGGLNLTRIDTDTDIALMKYHMYRGSLMDLSQDLRLDYQALIDWHRGAVKKYKEYADLIKDGKLGKIRSWDDVDKLFSTLKRGEQVAPSPVAAAKKALKKKALEKQYDEDVRVVQAALREKFPNLPDLNVRTVPNGVARHALEYDPATQTVLVQRDVAVEWATDFRKLYARGVQAGQWQPGTKDALGALTHEAGHHLVENTSVGEYKRLWQRVGKAIEWPRSSGIWEFTEGGGLRTGPVSGEKLVRLRRDAAAGKGIVPRQLEGPKDFPANKIGAASSKAEVDRYIKEWQGLGNGKQVLTSAQPVNRRIINNLSFYATRSPQEFLAEAISEYLTSNNPREIARAVGEYLSSKPNLRVVP